MAISIKRLEGIDLPAPFRVDGLSHAFLVTGWDGIKHYVDDDTSAAKLAAQLHLEDRVANGEADE